VIGGGAAGFFCADNAASQNKNLRVLIAEKSNKVLAKVRISGGGRCNVTHAGVSIAEMVKNYPRGEQFLKQAFKHFFIADTVGWFHERGVNLKTEADGRMFPESNNSETIIECLLTKANECRVEVLMNHEVINIQKNSTTGCKQLFQVTFKNGATLNSDFVCIACGGYPKAEQYKWISRLGHSFENPVPSLFTFNIPGNPIASLMGIPVDDVSVKINGTKFAQRGPLLITHWGFSGPVILKLSAFAAASLAAVYYRFTISVNWVPSYNENSLLSKFKILRLELAAKKIRNNNPFHLPSRLWQHHLDLAGIADGLRWADLPAKQQNILVRQLCSHEFPVLGKTTFKEEFVTAGGINLNEIDANTLASKIVPGLFFAGEILNVDGITGGFNFQHAWTSGWIASQGILAKLQDETDPL
jgi:predicted Rossmann fold flavoprotein